MSRSKDFVAVDNAGAELRIDPAGLSESARAFLPQLVGGAGLVEGGKLADAVGRDSKALQLPDAVARELGRALGRDGWLKSMQIVDRPLPPKPERKDFTSEVAYFQAAARHHEHLISETEGD